MARRGKELRRTRPRTRGPAARGALARMDGACRGGRVRLRAAGPARRSGAGGRQGLQPGADRRRHKDELRGCPYEIAAVAGGWSFRTRLGFGEAIRAAFGGPTKSELSKPNAVVLMAIAYFQPITRGELSQLLGREVSRDAIAALRARKTSSRLARAARPPARPTPMSRRRGSWRNSGSKVCWICQISKSCKRPGCSAERARTRLAAMRWRP
jgi:Segregation and condensation complex subunit ScpB